MASSRDTAREILRLQLADLKAQLEAGDVSANLHKVILEVLKELQVLEAEDFQPQERTDLRVLPFQDPEEHRDALEA